MRKIPVSTIFFGAWPRFVDIVRMRCKQSLKLIVSLRRVRVPAAAGIAVVAIINDTKVSRVSVLIDNVLLLIVVCLLFIYRGLPNKRQALSFAPYAISINLITVSS